MFIRFGWSLRSSKLFIELSGIIIAIVEVDRPTIESDGLPEFDVICSQKFTIFKYVLLSFKEFALWDA
jgi:hypothetical protein